MKLPNVKVEYREEDQLFLLLENLYTPEVVVPKGFRTDGFSVPNPLRWFNGRVGRGFAASVVHDYCYVSGFLNKKEADNLFYKNLRRCDVSKFRAKTMYYAVKLFGRGNFDGDR